MSQKQLSFIFFFVNFSLVFIASAYSATVFGPNELTVNKWHYHYSYHAFTVDAVEKGELIVTKTTPGKTVKGGFIIYNFRLIPLRKFLREKKNTLTRKIKLRAKNKMFVFLRGTPGGAISIEVKKIGQTNPPEARLSANPENIQQGETCALTWSTSNADTVTLEPGIGAVDPAGTINVSPSETTVYTLTASGGKESTTAQVKVKVSLPAPTVTITAEPDIIAPGKSSTLTWQSAHATACTIKPGIGKVATSGSIDVTPDKPTTYIIIAVGSGGTGRAQVLVQLYPIKIQHIDKAQASYTTPENTMAAASSALLQHDIEWFHKTFSEEAVAYEKQLYTEAGIDPASSFGLIDKNDEEYILDKKPYKDGMLIIIEKRANDIDGTILTTSAVLVMEDNLWKATFKYNGDEELNQYDDIQYTACIANYSFTPNFLDDSCWHGNDLSNYNKTTGAIDKRYGETLTVAVFNGINNGLGREQLNDMPREKFSMGGWIKAEPVDHTAGIIEIGRNRDDSCAIVMDQGNGLRYWIHVNGNRVERTTAMDYDFHDNQWHHVYLTYDGTTMNLYVDGQLKDSQPVSGAINSQPVLNIGQRNAAVNNGTADTFKGRLDDIQIYNKALTPEQIMKKYENGTTQPL